MFCLCEVIYNLCRVILEPFSEHALPLSIQWSPSLWIHDSPYLRSPGQSSTFFVSIFCRKQFEVNRNLTCSDLKLKSSPIWKKIGLEIATIHWNAMRVFVTALKYDLDTNVKFSNHCLPITADFQTNLAGANSPDCIFLRLLMEWLVAWRLIYGKRWVGLGIGLFPIFTLSK